MPIAVWEVSGLSIWALLSGGFSPFHPLYSVTHQSAAIDRPVAGFGGIATSQPTRFQTAAPPLQQSSAGVKGAANLAYMLSRLYHIMNIWKMHSAYLNPSCNTVLSVRICHKHKIPYWFILPLFCFSIRCCLIMFSSWQPSAVVYFFSVTKGLS